MKIRASLGTLAILRKANVRMDDPPTLAYLMQYSENGCEASCKFCTQSRTSSATKDFLSRVLWPEAELSEVVEGLKESSFRRVCLQTVIKKGFVEEALDIVREIHEETGLNISLSITPITTNTLRKFKAYGMDYLGVGLDAASPRVLKEVLKPYSWSEYMDFIRRGIDVLGSRHVVTHIIVGLGETPHELITTLETLRSMGSDISLFAFTPMKGTALEGRPPPEMSYYRFAQLATYLLMRGYETTDFLISRDGKPYIKKEFLIREFRSIRNLFPAFLTRGCPYCNRPYYTEAPGKEPYNFPSFSSLTRVSEDILLRELDEIIA